MALDFVQDWAIAQTLGEGAYGEVKLLVNKQNGEMVAMKIIDLSKDPQAKDYVTKEVMIHKMLHDPYIIRFFGRRQDANLEYIFLEYAPNGELFDRIEPDVGMKQWEAQKYMRQLISGVEYLHQRGVAHRDLKPENLLLDQHDNLKITDFGMATIFRINGKERALDKRCGTLPYVAPEVLSRPYAAEPADIWSCGIVLVAMLAGELPWDKAETDCDDFLAWRSGRYAHLSPWSKLDGLALNILTKVLYHVPSQRYTVRQIKAHRWFADTLPVSEKTDRDTKIDKVSAAQAVTTSCAADSGGGGKRKRMASDDWSAATSNNAVSLSQPATASVPTLPQLRDIILERQREATADAHLPHPLPVQSFSQPVQTTDMLISTQQLGNTQTLTQQNSWQKLVRRMTRFFVVLNVCDTLVELSQVLLKLKLTWKMYTPACVTINTVDRRKSVLVFKACIIEMDGNTMLDFRLSKGCGLEFKRYFVSIKSSLSKFIVATPLTVWTTAPTTS